jgi:hypothetical protein
VSTHHTHEQVHEATHHKDTNKTVAILIAALAALLAICEMGGKNAQNVALISNQDASNLWAFFQAKTIRMTAVGTAAETLDALGIEALPPAQREKAAKQIAKWKATAERYNSEPETREGRKELAVRAKEAEAQRDKALSAYHNFEFGSAAFQIAIVLASASIITGVAALAYIAIGLGAVGTALAALGWFAPTLLHF